MVTRSPRSGWLIDSPESRLRIFKRRAPQDLKERRLHLSAGKSRNGDRRLLNPEPACQWREGFQQCSGLGGEIQKERYQAGISQPCSQRALTIKYSESGGEMVD